MDFVGETPEMAIINLMVSDGDLSRGQRKSLLSTEIQKIEQSIILLPGCRG
jgi:hypothetical protein